MSDMTTAELAYYLRKIKDITQIWKVYYKIGIPNSCEILRDAADHLEIQEQRITELEREKEVWDKAWSDKCDRLEREIATYKQTFCPECHMPMGSNEKKCSECEVSWALEGEGK